MNNSLLLKRLRQANHPKSRKLGMLFAASPLKDRSYSCNNASAPLNNKVKLVTRKSYGFRTPQVAKLALLHNLGGLPEPKRTHRFC